VRACLHGGDARLGGIVGYPLDRLYEEVAFLAFHFHWPLSDILNLEHGDRHRFMDEISAINRQMNEAAGPSGPEPSKGIPLEVWAGLA
jgi:hypothetical protein